MKRVIAPLLLVFALAGCTGEPRGLVSGRVTDNGVPVTGAVVLFENAEEGRSINVPLDATGAFEAMSEGQPGLPLGSYQVAVRADAFSTGNEPPPLVGEGGDSHSEASTQIPQRYRNPTTSGIGITVREGENPPLEIDLSK